MILEPPPPRRGNVGSQQDDVAGVPHLVLGQARERLVPQGAEVAGLQLVRDGVLLRLDIDDLARVVEHKAIAVSEAHLTEGIADLHAKLHRRGLLQILTLIAAFMYIGIAIDIFITPGIFPAIGAPCRLLSRQDFGAQRRDCSG